MAFNLIRFLKRLLPQRERFKRYSELERRLGYRFENLRLLDRALTHRSYIHAPNNGSAIRQAHGAEQSRSTNSPQGENLAANERLEFLGDSVLGMVTSQFLFENFPGKSEGDLTKLKGTLVSEATLNRIARSICLGKYLNLSEEEDKSGGRERTSIIADAYEAVIGAIFLDGGLVPTQRVIKNQILKKCLELAGDKSIYNYKGELLEYMQALGWGMPRYQVLVEEGPDHQKKFTIAVMAKGKKMGKGEGLTKKEAEQKAAKMALENIDKFLEEFQKDSEQ
ncbi:MAG: ribonuclease III [candidate division Zixibacteria bacterium]|nr:ribonuclease III [candidate division Zixibacteria bacterium]MCK4428563.1 ribonuclease III [candidate division Zixibacteria bacterium]